MKTFYTFVVVPNFPHYPLAIKCSDKDVCLLVRKEDFKKKRHGKLVCWMLYTCRFLQYHNTLIFPLFQFSEWMDHDKDIPDIGKFPKKNILIHGEKWFCYGNKIRDNK